MIPSEAVARQMLSLLAADPTTLAKATAAENKVALVTSPFTPSRDLTLGGLTLAAFPGSTPLIVGTGPQPVAFDTMQAQWFIQLLEPAGGWFWRLTGTLADAVQVFGIVLTDNAGAVMLGSALLPQPILVQSIDDSVPVGYIRFYESDLVAG